MIPFVFKVHFLWQRLPILFVSANCLPKNWIATSLGLIVLIRTDYFSDLPTIAHELEHCRQSIKGLGLIHFCRYYWSTAYRLRCEAAAFAVEIRCYEDAEIAYRTAVAVKAMVHCYGLNCTSNQARDSILVELNKM